jgi:hypothetical protein
LRVTRGGREGGGEQERGARNDRFFHEHDTLSA